MVLDFGCARRGALQRTRKEGGGGYLKTSGWGVGANSSKQAHTHTHLEAVAVKQPFRLYTSEKIAMVSIFMR
jgi:hypothetical protein